MTRAERWRQYWRRLAHLAEWHATGSLWAPDWEAVETAELRVELGVVDRLERAPTVASDADVVWQPKPNEAGFRPYHTALWHCELRPGK